MQEYQFILLKVLWPAKLQKLLESLNIKSFEKWLVLQQLEYYRLTVFHIELACLFIDVI